jgi:hypothetical protein
MAHSPSIEGPGSHDGYPNVMTSNAKSAQIS